ncbi:MAG: hypothetical protein AB7T86_03315 [Xanthobacteraceae bacterium]|jgi:hypothetical protein|uniref:hypothetical protein n=1 Tax=Pseudolabrys sp. TaxID=1960880 RepID=UPI003D0F32E6
MPNKYERRQRKAIRNFRYLTAQEESESRAAAIEKATSAFSVACELVARHEFQQVLRGAGVDRVPNLLLSISRPDLHPSLLFLIAWTFIRFVSKIETVAVEMKRKHPDLLGQMNEAFVGLVEHGPFPPPMILCDLREIVEDLATSDTG